MAKRNGSLFPLNPRPSLASVRNNRTDDDIAWIYLFTAGLFEVAWAVGLKFTEGFTRLWPSAGTVPAMIVSFLFLAESLKSIPLGTGYAVWTGIGLAGTAVMGILLFDESRDPFRIICILVIVGAIAGLRLSSPT